MINEVKDQTALADGGGNSMDIAPNFRSMSITRPLGNFIRWIAKLHIFEKGLQKLVYGKPNDSLLVKCLPFNTQYPANSNRRVTLNAINYLLDISQYVDWSTYYGVDDQNLRRFVASIKAGSTIVDIGANIGTVTLRAAQATGKAGRVICFEPNPATFNRLTENLNLNPDLKNIQAVPKGLGAKEGSFLLVDAEPNNVGMSHLARIGEAKAGKEVQVVRLDDYLEVNQVGKVDAIKIDVEGFEYQVLLGAEATIKRYLPTIMLEVDDEFLRAQGGSATQLRDYLLNLGYVVTDAKTDKAVVQNAQIPIDYHGDWWCEALAN